MQLLVVLFALLLRRLWNPPSIYTRRSEVGLQLHSFWDWPGIKERSATFGYLILSITVILIFGVIYQQFAGWFFGLAGITIHVILLSLVLGPLETEEGLTDYLPKWRAQDQESLKHLLQEEYDVEVKGDPWDLHFQFWELWLTRWLERLFTPLFWYLLLGPLVLVWILLNRLLLTKVDDEGQTDPRRIKLNHTIETLQQALTWIPARLLAITFLLTGNFAKVVDDVGRGLINWQLPESELIAESAKEALTIQPWLQHAEERITQAERQLLALRRLLFRTISVWIGAIAIITILFG